MRILTRYVLRSMAGPFVFALSAITLLMLLNELGRRFGRLLGKGLDAAVIVEVFALSLPFILAMTLPMAVLAAVLYTFNRMASDNEITAIKASGVHLPRLLVPAVAAATVLALGMVWFNNTVLPDSNHRLQVLLSSISRKKPTFVLKERTINEVLEEELYIQVARVDRASNELADVVIYDHRLPQQTRVIYADSGKMALSEDGTDLFLTLRHGHSAEQKSEQPNSLQRLQFRSMVMRVPDVSNRLQRSEMGGYRGDREMTIAQLQAEVDDARRQASHVALESRTYAEALTLRLLGREVEEPEALERRLLRGEPSDATTDESEDGGGDAAADTTAAGRTRAAEETRAAGRNRAAEESRAAAGRNAVGAPGPADSGTGRPESPRGATPGNGPESSQASGGASPPEGRPVSTGDTGRSDAVAAGAAASGTAAAGSAAGAAAVDTAAVDARVQALEQVRRVGSARTPGASFGSLTRRRATSLSQANRYAVEIHKKYSIPAACIVFVLIGGPLAVRYREAGVAMVVAASLLIFCAYYVSLVGGEELADELILSPFWAMWAPNVLFGAVGLALLWRSVKV